MAPAPRACARASVLASRLITLAPIAAALVALAPGPAAAGEITGGCTGTVNGVDAATITRDDPLVVHAGEQLRVEGSIPAELAADDAVSTTKIKVSIVDGIFGLSSDEHDSTGPTYLATDVDVDDYLTVGVGLYRVDIVNEGLAWRCEYTGYIALAGDPLSKPAGLVALAAVLMGVVGLLFVKGRKPTEPGWIDGELGTATQIAREEAWQAAGSEFPDAIRFDERATRVLAPPRELAPNERLVWSGKARKTGQPVAGFFWGVLLGLGIGVLGWQDSRWTVNLGSVVIVPLAVGAVGALVAWLGWAYRIRDVAVLPADAGPEDGALPRPDGQLSFDDPLGPDPDSAGSAADGNAVPEASGPAEPSGLPETAGTSGLTEMTEPGTPPAE